MFTLIYLLVKRSYQDTYMNLDLKFPIFFKNLKPIFHQNAKYLASGVGVGQYTRRQYFALPNAKYTNMLVYFALADANFLRRPCTFHFLCVDFFALGSHFIFLTWKEIDKKNHRKHMVVMYKFSQTFHRRENMYMLYYTQYIQCT